MTKSELQNIIEDPTHKKEIVQSVLIDNKSSFFSESILDVSNSNYGAIFLDNAEAIINNAESFSRFKTNLSFPLEVNEIINSTFSQLKKIFYGEDRYFKIEKSKEIIDIDLDFIREKLFTEYKNSPNSKIVLAKKDKEYEPFFISSSQIIDYSMINDAFEWIFFKDTKKFYYYSQTQLLAFENNEDKIGEIVLDESNNSNVCPVFFVSNEKLNSKNNFVRKNAFTNMFGMLENLQRLEVFKKIITPHAFYSYIVKFKERNCNYDDGYSHCDNGYLVGNKNESSILDKYKNPVKCPQCNEDIGVGNQLPMPIFNQLEHRDVINTPIQFISPDKNILAYSDSFLIEKRKETYNSILGIENNLNDKVANTAEAYNYNSTSREQVILNLKSNFEKIISQYENGKQKLKLSDKKIIINLGSKFLITSASLLVEDLKLAKEQNLPTIQLKEQIIKKQYENDIDGKIKALAYNRFYPDILIEEIRELGVSNEVAQKQLYFNDFINVFETENKTEFDDVNKLVLKLNEQFKKYIKQFKTKEDGIIGN